MQTLKERIRPLIVEDESDRFLADRFQQCFSRLTFRCTPAVRFGECFNEPSDFAWADRCDVVRQPDDDAA